VQSRKQSLVEAFVNIGSGFLISLGLWQILAAWYGYDMPLSRNMEITTIFTFVSIARSYIFRRIFTRISHRSRVRNETSDGVGPARRADGSGTDGADGEDA
jgi:hypothetical protein